MTDELTLEQWDHMPARERQVYAKRLVRELPDGFAFRAIEAHKLGDQQHRFRPLQVRAGGGAGDHARRRWRGHDLRRSRLLRRLADPGDCVL